jgi:hypothetical protein
VPKWPELDLVININKIKALGRDGYLILFASMPPIGGFNDQFDDFCIRPAFVPHFQFSLNDFREIQLNSMVSTKIPRKSKIVCRK